MVLLFFLCLILGLVFAGEMAGEFSFTELAQLRQGRRSRRGQAVARSSIAPTTGVTRIPLSEQPSGRRGEQPSAGPSIPLTVPSQVTERREIREPTIIVPSFRVSDSSSDEEPIALSLKKKGKRPATVDPEEIPPPSRPRVTEPSESQNIRLPPSVLGTAVPIVPSPRRPGENEDSILFNRNFALKVASSVSPIPDRQYVMQGGLEMIMNDLVVSATQVIYLLFCCCFGLTVY